MWLPCHASLSREQICVAGTWGQTPVTSLESLPRQPLSCALHSTYHRATTVTIKLNTCIHLYKVTVETHTHTMHCVWLLCTPDSPGTKGPGLFGVSVTNLNSRRPFGPCCDFTWSNFGDSDFFAMMITYLAHCAKVMYSSVFILGPSASLEELWCLEYRRR